MNTAADLEGFLLGDNVAKPAPNCGGDRIKKTVLIFHCEIREKRAPTLYVERLHSISYTFLIIVSVQSTFDLRIEL